MQTADRRTSFDPRPTATRSSNPLLRHGWFLATRESATIADHAFRPLSASATLNHPRRFSRRRTTCRRRKQYRRSSRNPASARWAANLNAVYHFTFTGKEQKEATITIRNGTLRVDDGHQGAADLYVTADSETWLGFLAKERSLLWALLRRRIRIKGSPRLLVAFGKSFPS